MHFLGKTLLDFALLHSVFQGQICLLLQAFLDFLLLHSSPRRLAKFLNLRSYLGRILHVAVFFKAWKLLSLLDSSDFRGAAYFNHLLLRLEPQYNMLSIV